MNSPRDCPRCESDRTLEPYGAEVQGMRWFYCTSCSTPVLIRIITGEILRIGKP
jgi:transposase-like protein